MKNSSCIVALLPDNAQAEVPVGTLLSDAIRQAGLEAYVPCGGQGRCGRCLVRIEKGTVQRRPNSRLTAKQIAQGWALSCQTEVTGNVSAFLPPDKTRVEEEVAGTAALKAPREAPPPRDPVVSHHLIELNPPTLQDNAADLERLRRTLAGAPGIRNLDAGVAVARDLHRTLKEGEWKATAVVEHALRGGRSRLVAVRPHDATGTSLGAAIDIGTTTVTVALLDLRSGRIIDHATAFNRQISCGEDVISRIVYSQRGDGLEHLRRLVRETINDLLARLYQRQGVPSAHVDHVAVAGNTTMTHLFLGLEPRSIREEPYAPVATAFPTARSADVGLDVNPEASVYCVPAVAAYVGGDITAGILSAGLDRRRELTLFMDVGTNGELVLGNSDWLVACACSAGPALEGGGVDCGMPATAGAIEGVTINQHTLVPTLQVIGGGAPRGICGSGMIAALGEMFITGVVDKAGRFAAALAGAGKNRHPRLVDTDHGHAYVLAWGSESATGENIILTEVDVSSLIHTKAAIYAGLAVMLRALDIEAADIQAVLIGGGFGQHINVEKSILIGLLPDLPWDRFRFLGNTSAFGASRALVSRRVRRQVEEIAGKVTYMELVADNTFMNEFTSSLFLPHTDLDAFPSVRETLAQIARTGTGPDRAGERRRP